MSSTQTTYHAQALARGIDIVRHVAAKGAPGATLAELHASTSLPKSTLVRLLAVLEQEGFVNRVDDQPTFRIGHGVVSIAESYRRMADIVGVASAHLRELALTTRQTANLGVIDRAQVLHLCVEEPDRPLRFRSTNGSYDDLHCTALGKILLAGVDEAAARALLQSNQIDRRTANTITHRDRLLADVAVSRQRGYAVDDEEGAAGVRCLAVPLADDPSTERWGAAVSVSGPAAEVSPENFGTLLRALRRTTGQMLSDPELVTTLALVSGRPEGVRERRAPAATA